MNRYGTSKSQPVITTSMMSAIKRPPPLVAPRSNGMVNVIPNNFGSTEVSLEKYQLMVSRNDLLVAEVAKLRNDIRIMEEKKRHVFVQMMRQFERVDASTQTDEYPIPNSNSEPIYSIDKRNKKLLALSQQREIKRQPQSPCVKPYPPVQVVSEIDPKERTRESNEPLEENRPQRTIRKPVSYSEPSLKVKVRKGFQFFRY